MLEMLKLLQNLDRLEIYPYQAADKLRIHDPHKRLTVELRSQLKKHRSVILDRLATKQTVTAESIYDLSPMQITMLFQSQLTPNSGTFIEQILLHVDDATFDPARFIKAMQQVINHHDSLRAAFHFAQGKDPVQVIQSQALLPVTVLDWQEMPTEEYPPQLEALVAQDRQTDFDFAQAPLLRLTVVELNTQHGHCYDLLFTFHHILMDRWSLDLFWTAVQCAYTGLPLPQATPYQAYIHHLRQQPEDARFWQEYLCGFSAPTPLPGITRPVPAQTQAQTANLMKSFSYEESQHLTDFARTQGLTLNALFQAAWAVLLARYSNETDVLFGIVTSGRTAPVAGIESILGLFINTLPFRIQLESNPTGIDLLQQVAQIQLDLQQREHTPALEIRQWSEVRAGTNLYETVLLFQNTPQTMGDTDISQLKIRSGDLEAGETGYPLLAYIAPVYINQPMSVKISYNTSRYGAETIQRILDHWQQLILAMVAQPEQPVHNLPMLTDAEYHRIVHKWNDTAVDFGKRNDLYALFEAQVAQTPNAIAFMHHEQQMTYAELLHRSQQLAHYLQALGAKKGDIIGLCLPRSFDAVVSLLAIFQIGGIYLPLDPTYPCERLLYILSDAQAPFLLTRKMLGLQLTADRCQEICLDTAATSIAEQRVLPASVLTTPDDIAQIIYTSGSTGQPKGAVVPYKQMLNRLSWMWRVFPFQSNELSCHKTALNFVDALWEMLGPLLQGTPTVIIDDDVVRDPVRLIDTLETNGVTRLFLVPTLLQVILNHLQRENGSRSHNQLSKLTFVAVGGEALPTSLYHQFQQVMPHSHLYNIYGTSELWDAFWYEPEPAHLHLPTVPIGRPIDNMEVYILDDHRQCVPIGVIGELYVGGVGLATGYLNRPQLTQQKFIAHPFKPDAYLYASGDLARWLPDGNIEYIGRTDFQIKLRGFRIELGEIENALLAQDDVREAVVLVREETEGTGAHWERLVAYVVAESQSHRVPPGRVKSNGREVVKSNSHDVLTMRPNDQSTLRHTLAQQLPYYMIPSAFICLEAMPMTPSGKIDRRALAEYPLELTSQREAALAHRPRTVLEQQIAAVWEQTLDVYPVGIHDNFFEIGGHSLLAIQLVARLEPVIQRQLPLRELLASPTIALLAERVEQSTVSADEPTAVIPLQPRGTESPLICVPGLGGSPLYLYTLAQAMGTERPFYALESPGLDGKTPPLTTVAAAAAYKIEQLQRHRPALGSAQQPYYLAGHSFGAYVAYEMAQQLHKAGKTVGGVLLLDIGAPAGKAAPMGEVERLLTYERIALEEYGLEPTLTEAQLTPLTSEERLFCLKESLESAGFLPADSPMERFRGTINVAAADQQALDYLPTDPAPLPIDLFVATEEDDGLPRSAEMKQEMIESWSPLGGVTAHEVPGSHTTLLHQPHVAVLAERLQAAIASLEANARLDVQLVGDKGP